MKSEPNHPSGLPTFLVIGAPRAGTTWIARNLREHPDVYLWPKKEPHFFDKEENYRRGIKYYETFFTASGDAQAIGEITPDYIHAEKAAIRIKQHLPMTKLIVSLRNPVERLYSRYWNARGKFSANAELSFEQKLIQKPSFIYEGLYFQHLSRYLELFDRSQLLILVYDDLEADSFAFMRQIYEFLGVAQNFRSSALERRINSAVSRKRNVRSQTLYYLRRIAERLRLYSISDAIDRVNVGSLPAIRPETRKWLLREHYEKEIRGLEGLIERDLSRWRKMPE